MTDSGGAGATLGERLASARAASAARATYARPLPAAAKPAKLAKPAKAADGSDNSDDSDDGDTPAAPAEPHPLPGRRGPGAAVARRARKDAPREVSSRRPVPYGRARCLGLEDGGGFSGGRRRVFDPRFEEHCGELRVEHAERNFGFVEGLREKERDEMRRALAKGEAGAELRERLRREEEGVRRKAEEKRREEIRRELKREEREKVKGGKKPWFFKESDVRERELEVKFQELKKKGGVQKYIEKRRKRSAGKDRKLLPDRRSGASVADAE